MAVPLLDLNAQNQKYANDLQAAFSRIIGSSQFILGREGHQLRGQYSVFVGFSPLYWRQFWDGCSRISADDNWHCSRR